MLLGTASYFVYTHLTQNNDGSCKALIPHPVIVAFGDSLVTGYGAPEGHGFVDNLASEIGVPITNLGVVGNTTADGVARIQDVVDLHPNIVLVLLGGNDALQKKSQAETAANLDKILYTLTSNNIHVVLLAAPGAFLSDPYASMYKDLSQKYKTELVPNVLSGLLGHGDLMSDAVHPNTAGYSKLAAKVLPHLDTLCNKVTNQKGS